MTKAVPAIVGGLALMLAVQFAVSGRAPCDPVPALFMPGRVSTAANEYCVRFDPDMDEMYVMRGSLDDQTAILRFKRTNGVWGRPVLVTLAPQQSAAYPFLTPDGSRIMFDVLGSGAGGGSDIWSATRIGDNWATPAPVAGVNSKSVDMHASVAANGNLYFCSNRPGGLGGFDIYRAARISGGYATPENLGPAINSTESDFHPYVAPDESYLLFDSRRTGGFGSNDLYVSFHGPDGRWAPAVNLGPAVNTRAGEMRPYVAPDGKALYFCSDRSVGNPQEPPSSLEAFERRANGPGSGSQDIYRVSTEVIERLRPARVDQPRVPIG